MILGLPRPAILTIAANGAYRTKLDHSHLPLTPDEHCACALACHQAGASLYRLALYNPAVPNVPMPSDYAAVIREIDRACEDQMPVQLDMTDPNQTEQGEHFATQRADIEHIKPKAFSIAFRDLFPKGAEEKREGEARDFLDECQNENIAVQFIFDHVGDLDWFYAYRQYGLISQKKPMLLFDLTKAHKRVEANAHALRPYLAKLDQLNLLSQVQWSVCAPDCAELPIAVASLTLGGHCQIGLAHNLHDGEGEVAKDNASQLAPLMQISQNLGRPSASAFESLALLRG